MGNGWSGAARRNQDEDAGRELTRERDDEELPILEDWLAPDEVEEVGDLGNALDDEDGPEQSLHWREIAAPSRESLLLHRISESLRQLGALRAKRASADDEQRVPDEVWRRLGDEALGISSPAREADEQQRQAARSDADANQNALPKGIADSMAVNLAGFLRVISWLESGARMDRHAQIVKSLASALGRDIPSRMPR